MPEKRTAHHIHLNEKGDRLWEESAGYRKRVKKGAQYAADDAGIPIVIRNSGVSGQDRVLIILYPKPPKWIHR